MNRLFNTNYSVRGFTIIELMLVIVIMGILLALAAPTFQQMMERYRVRQAAEGLKASLYLARSEALKRGGNVIVDSSSGGWNYGWEIVCTGSGTTCTDKIIQHVNAMPNVIVSASGNPTTIEFDRWGMNKAKTDITFILYPNKGATSSSTDCSALVLTMSVGGSIKAASGGASTSC